MKKTTSFKANEDTRIWCEYCRIFVYNNRINREKHDNSPQHQANFKKKVEILRKEEEEKKKLQVDIKSSSPSKSFYSTSTTSKSYTSTSSAQPVNILNLKTSSVSSSNKPAAEKKTILGLSNSPNITKTVIDNSMQELTADTPTIRISGADIKSASTDLKRKIKEDEKYVPDSNTNDTEESANEADTLKMLSLLKKKKAKQ